MDGEASTRASAAAREALERISQSDWNRLHDAARLLCAVDSIAPDELMSWVFAAYLSGRRAWRPDVKPFTQLRNAMRSMLSSLRNSRKRHPEVSLEEFLLSEDSDTDGMDGYSPLEPEEEARFEQVVAIVTAHFADDSVASDVLDALWKGMTPDEIQECLDMDATTYASTRRRIKRKFYALIESGAFR